MTCRRARGCRLLEAGCEDGCLRYVGRSLVPARLWALKTRIEWWWVDVLIRRATKRWLRQMRYAADHWDELWAEYMGGRT